MATGSEKRQHARTKSCFEGYGASLTGGKVGPRGVTGVSMSSSSSLLVSMDGRGWRFVGGFGLGSTISGGVHGMGYVSRLMWWCGGVVVLGPL